MDDLNEKLNRLLSSPEGMAKIQSAMAALSGGQEPPTPAPAQPVQPAPRDGGSLPDMAALTRLLPLLSGMGQDSEDTRLLQALRPYLHGPREQRLDEAVRLLRLAKLLPLLQEQGILTGTGGNNHGG